MLYLKVSKSQKNFSWKSIAQKTNEIFIRQNSALLRYGKILSNISFFFGAMEFQEKGFWYLLTFSKVHGNTQINDGCALHKGSFDKTSSDDTISFT